MLHGTEGWMPGGSGGEESPESEEPTISRRVISGKWLVPRQGTNLGLPIIYGTRRTGGILFYQEVSADNNILYRKYALAEGVQQAWTMYVNKVSYTSSKYYNATEAERHIDSNIYLGSDTGTNHDGGAAWTSSHACKGIAFHSVNFVYDAEKRVDANKFEEEPFFEALPEILFEMTGKAITDNSSVSKDSDDPAWVLYEYLTNSRYGAGLTAAQIDTTSFATASTICADTNSTSPAVKQYAANIILDPLASLMTNIKRILATCNGRLHWIDGKYYLHIDDEFSGTAAFAFEEKHILGGISIFGNSKNERTNQVTAKFVNPNLSWKEDEVSWPAANHDENEDGDSDIGTLYNSYLSEDKEVPLRKTINLGGVTNFNQARFLAKQACLRSRDALKCSFTTTSEAMEVVVGDVITVTHSTPGWSAKEFRVRSISLNLDGTCSISAVEHLDSIYAWDFKTEPSAAADTNLPDVTTVSIPYDLKIDETIYSSIISGGKKIRVTLSWTDSTDTFIQNHEFQFKNVTITDQPWIEAGTSISSSGLMNDFEKGLFVNKHF